MKLYGIKNCDTVKKAIKQLDSDNVAYEFVDLKTTKLSVELLTDWLTQCPDKLVNKRSTTYRQIKEEWLSVEDNLSAQITLIQANPTLIKRPVIVLDNGEIIVGFDKGTYQELG